MNNLEVIDFRDIPSFLKIDWKDIGKVDRYRSNAKVDLYLSLLVGSIYLITLVYIIRKVNLFSKVFASSSISIVQLIVSFFIAYVFYWCILKFPFRMYKIATFDPMSSRYICCYCSIKSFCSKKDSYYVNVLVSDTNFLVKKAIVSRRNYYKMKKKNFNNLILVSYDNCNAYVIPV